MHTFWGKYEFVLFLDIVFITYKTAYQNPGYKHRSFSCPNRPEPCEVLRQSAGSEPIHADARNESGRKFQGLLSSGECCRRWNGLFALLLLCKDNIFESNEHR